MKIYCVCGFGLGSSLIAKMNLENILASEGIDAKVENCDIGSITGINADFLVATKELANNIPSELRERTIVLDDFINPDAMKATIIPRLLAKR